MGYMRSGTYADERKGVQMLIRWADKKERSLYTFSDDEYKELDVLIAVHRMTDACGGILGFSRENKEIGKVLIFDAANGPEIESALRKCALRQMEPKGGSFHYRYPEFARESRQEDCPCCNHTPMPAGMEDIAELEYAWVTAEAAAQGRLFGKCVVGAKYHSVHFYDMPAPQMAGFMGDVQKVARVLHRVTQAVKINYEMHGNSGPHLHCHLFPRYLDDDFPSGPIDYRITEPSPYESEEEYRWFIREMKKGLLA